MTWHRHVESALDYDARDDGTETQADHDRWNFEGAISAGNDDSLPSWDEYEGALNEAINPTQTFDPNPSPFIRPDFPLGDPRF